MKYVLHNEQTSLLILPCPIFSFKKPIQTIKRLVHPFFPWSDGWLLPSTFCRSLLCDCDSLSSRKRVCSPSSLSEPSSSSSSDKRSGVLGRVSSWSSEEDSWDNWKIIFQMKMYSIFYLMLSEKTIISTISSNSSRRRVWSEITVLQ